MRIRDKDATLARLGEALTSGIVPHNSWLGLRAVDIGDASVTVELPYDPKLVGNPETGVLHGGALCATLDATCGLAVFIAMGKPSRIATIDLRIDYLRPATPGKSVLCRAECFKVTHHVAFTRAVAYQDGPGDLVASAAATYALFPSESSSRRRR